MKIKDNILIEKAEHSAIAEMEIQILEEERFKFDEKEHVYTLDNKPMHGTTTVLKILNKPALIQWAANQACEYIKSKWSDVDVMRDGFSWFEPILEEARTAHRKKKEEAGVKGTDTHAEIEKLIKVAMEVNNGKVEAYMVNESMSEQVKEFVQWAILNDVTFLESEKRLYSEDWWTAGTTDFIAKIKDKLYIGDVKTGRDIYQEYWYQTGAYAKMAVEMGLYEKFDGLVVVNVPKTGGIKVQENYDLEGNQKAFECALYLHKKQN